MNNPKQSRFILISFLGRNNNKGGFTLFSRKIPLLFINNEQRYEKRIWFLMIYLLGKMIYLLYDEKIWEEAFLILRFDS